MKRILHYCLSSSLTKNTLESEKYERKSRKVEQTKKTSIDAKENGKCEKETKGVRKEVNNRKQKSRIEKRTGILKVARLMDSNHTV